MMADALRVVLVDDEALVRSGLRLLLSNAPDIEVVAEASNGRDAVATVLDAQPDVVLMDIRMKYGSIGVSADRQGTIRPLLHNDSA